MVTAKKAANKVTPAMQKTDRPVITITKSGTCPTLSQKGRLGYDVGTDGEKKLYYRVTKNDGGGHFSGAWVSAEAIRNALAKTDPITAYPLRAITQGSVNTAGFLLAVLVAECLIEKLQKKLRHYKWIDPSRNTTPTAASAKSSARPKKPAKK